MARWAVPTKANRTRVHTQLDILVIEHAEAHQHASPITAG